MTSLFELRTQLTYVSYAALEPWQSGNFEEAEERLAEEIVQDKHPGDTYARANRALLRVRREKWDDALKDVQAITVTGFTFHGNYYY